MISLFRFIFYIFFIMTVKRPSGFEDVGEANQADMLQMGTTCNQNPNKNTAAPLVCV